jgi:hypothetical protein
MRKKTSSRHRRQSAAPTANALHFDEARQGDYRRWSSFGINVEVLRALKGGIFLLKMPLRCVLSVYTNSETAVSPSSARRARALCRGRPISLGLTQHRRYHRSMTPLTPPPRVKPLWRALVEIAFIVFLFYSNLLMGEFTGVNGQNKTFAFALRDIITPTNFLIAVVSAIIGYGIFEFLRKKL